MIAGFDWWLLLVGVVAGAGLTWLVLADFRRHEDEVAEGELELEAGWIAAALVAAGRSLDEPTVAEVLRLHRAWLAGPAAGPELVGPAPGPELTDDSAGQVPGP